MTVSRLIQEIQLLSPEERLEVSAFLQRDARPVVRYVDRETAIALTKEIFTKHSELFRKLAE